MAPTIVTRIITTMSSGGSPYRSQPKDLESGGGSGGGFQDFRLACDPVDVVGTNRASVHCLKNWKVLSLIDSLIGIYLIQQEALTVLASREDEEQIIAEIDTHAQDIKAAYLFVSYGETADGTRSPIPTGNCNFSPEQRDRDFSALQNLGGVRGLTETLKTNPDTVINDSESNVLGSNRYPPKKVGRNMANIHYHSNTLTGRVGENASSAHPRDWMFGDNFGKWVAFIGTYCTASAVLVAFIPLKYSGTLSAYETHGWLLITSLVGLAMTIFTSWIKFYTNDDLQNLMKKNISPVYNMILNSVFWFSAIISHLSLVLVILLPHNINWVGYAVLCPIYVVVFAFTFIGLIKVIWERARR